MNHPEFDAYSKEITELIGYDETAIDRFHFYGFEWIDNLNFLRSSSEVIPDRLRRTALETAVARRFTCEGWEGTGRLALLWLPGFVFPMSADIPTEGVLVWHVKQHEDGISWLLSPVPLPFEVFGGGQHNEEPRAEQAGAPIA